MVSVLVREGDVIAGNDGVIEVETEKAVVEIPCPHAGKVVKVHVTKGQTIKVGQPLLTIEAEAEAAEKPRPAVAPRNGETASGSHGGKSLTLALSRGGPAAAGPEARRVARELGVDLAQVQGSGKGGRITVEDVRAAAAARRPSP